MDLEINREEVSEIPVLRLVGRIDTTTAPMLEKSVKEEKDRGDKKLLLDFSRIDYLSSSGMRFLLAATKQFKTEGGIIALCHLSTEVAEIITMAGFERILHIYATESEALSELKG